MGVSALGHGAFGGTGKMGQCLYAPGPHTWPSVCRYVTSILNPTVMGFTRDPSSFSSARKTVKVMVPTYSMTNAPI